jgi:hypothetical protein
MQSAVTPMLCMDLGSHVSFPSKVHNSKSAMSKQAEYRDEIQNEHDSSEQ